MIWDTLAPMLVMITGILTAGGVIILRPLSKRLAELLHVMAQERVGAPRSTAELAQVRDLLASMESRLSLLEERQNFTEALMDERRLQLEPRSGAADIGRGHRPIV